MLENHPYHIKRQLIRVPVRWMLLFIFVFATIGGLHAQRTAFLYLQSEEGIPFYVKRDKQIYSSTASGYLILSKLPENDLLFYVGFPGSSNPESLFRLPIGNGGKGVLIKSFGEKGWGLFDFQDASVTYAMATENNEDKKAVNNNRQPVNDPFANMLSDVTKDSTVKYIGDQVKQPPALEPKDSVKVSVAATSVIIQTDSSAITSVPVVQIINEEQSENIVQTKEKPVFPKSEIIRSRVEPGADGTTISYFISNSQLMKDTVNVFIPSEINSDEKNSDFVDSTRASSPILTDLEIVSSDSDSTSAFFETQEENDIVVDTMKYATENVTDTTSQSISEQVQESASTTMIDTTISINSNPVVLDTIPVIVDNQKIELVSDEKAADKVQEKNPILIEVNCKKTASEVDFKKVRSKMAQQSKDEEMINEAMKFFKNTCFTTEQIRNLGVLFLTDEGRYRFYDASMKYVLDFQNFRSLENTLITPYYKKRFEALIPE